jgi:hypothetical protein
MRTHLVTIAMMMVTGASSAEVYAANDAINGAFGRMLAHEAIPLASARQTVDDASDFQFDRRVNAVVRGEVSSLELGFAHMLERVDDAPAALTVRGEPDAVELMVATALRLQAQSSAPQRHAAL